MGHQAHVGGFRVSAGGCNGASENMGHQGNYVNDRRKHRRLAHGDSFSDSFDTPLTEDTVTELVITPDLVAKTAKGK
jgi:hypothetical protein